jgi:hypothetical protein
MPQLAILECSKSIPVMTLSEIFRQRQTALGLSDWDIAKQVSINRGAEPDRYASAALKAIKNLDEGAKFPMIKDLFLVLGVDIETAIAIAASTPPKP